MGEPVTTGMMIGAALGGGSSALRGKDPIKGALIGGLTGAAGGAASGAMMGGTAGATGGGFAGGGYGSIGTAGATASGAGSGGMFSGMSNMFSGMPSSIKGLGQDISAANTWMNQNPTTSQIGFKLAQEMLQAPEQVPMPGGMPVNRGQIQPMDYMSLLNPQQQSAMRPAPVSLL